MRGVARFTTRPLLLLRFESLFLVHLRVVQLEELDVGADTLDQLGPQGPVDGADA